MSPRTDSPAQLASLLLDPERGSPFADSDAHTIAGIAIYRNNVAAALTDALSRTFPVCHQLVGPDFFAAIAIEFARQHPPRSAAFIGYGREFPDFLDNFPPLATIPYLGDVARVELAVLMAYQAGDRPAGDGQNHPSGTSVVLDPSVQLVRTEHAAGSIWSDHARGEHSRDLDPMKPEDILVWRRDGSVYLALLDEAGLALMRRLLAGDALADVPHSMAKGFSGDLDLRWTEFAREQLLISLPATELNGERHV